MIGVHIAGGDAQNKIKSTGHLKTFHYLGKAGHFFFKGGEGLRSMGINFMVPDNYPWYQFTAVAGLIPDLYYHEHGYRPKDDQMLFRDLAHTDWLPVNVPAPAGKLIITGLPEQKPESCSIMIAVGIAFGTIQRGEIEQVKYVGAGKVIGME